MTDYSEAEMGAISTFSYNFFLQLFPTCQIYPCDFHGEQAWERWTKERKHGLSADDTEVLLSLLRDCAHAPSATHAELPIDHHSQQQLNNLKKSRI